MNFKFSLICVLIFVLIFTSCSKKSETQAAEALAAANAEKILHGDLSAAQTKTAAGSGSYAKILAGDMSDFAGTWANAYTQNQLFANGVFVNSSTRSIDGITTGDFNENNGAYMWSLYDGGHLGYEIGLYPAGVQIYLGQNLVVSDTSKDRILIFQFDGFPTNDDVFYLSRELPAQIAANIPADILDKINKRIASIENGDIAAFRATLAHPEDAGDYYYQLSLLNTFFGEIFDIDGVAFLEAISDGTDELQDFANKLFHETRPLRNRNIGLRIISIEDIPNEWVYRVTLASNSNEEIIHNYRYSSF